MSERATDVEPFRGVLEKTVALIVPWTFVAGFTALYVWLLLPRAGQNALFAALAMLAGLALVSSLAAALTFTTDVLSGRSV